jgi:tetratricopeptide (TPR) repeat protein
MLGSGVTDRFGLVAAALLAGMAHAQAQHPFGPEIMQENQRIHPDVFFSGQVQIEGGSAPAEPVAMVRMCYGQTHFETWTDAKGGFSFHVGATGKQSSQADASENSASRPALGSSINMITDSPVSAIDALRNCQLEARLAGFRSDPISISVRDRFDDGRLGVITLHPLSKASALTVSATALAAPANARKAYEKGLDALASEKWQAAADEFTKAVTAYPKFAGAWYQLGVLRQQGHDDAGAMDAWKHAVASDPQYITPYEKLTVVAGSLRDWAASEEYSRAWIHLDPEEFPGAYLFNAIANSKLNRTAEAEAAARAGLRIDRGHGVPKLSFVLAMILMGKHENAEAVQRFREYLALAPDAKDAAAVRQQVSQLEAAAAAKPR